MKNSGVFPCSDSSSADDLIFSGTAACSLIKTRLPPVNILPSALAVRPFPATALNSLTSSAETPFSSPYLRTAFARGCSLFFSSAYASRSNSSSATPSAVMISVTSGCPLVMVPVLSSATICTLPVSSRETAVLKSRPFFAPTPLPTIMATGVASPSAHGQLITSTEMALASE